MPVLGLIWSTVLAMFMSLATAPAIKWLITEILEQAVEVYERRAAKSADTEDDAWAKSFRRVLDFCKEQWK